MADSEQTIAAGEQLDQRVWLTTDVPRKQRFSYYRDAICDAFMPLAPERPRNGAADFRARVSSIQAGPIVANRVSATSHCVARGQVEIVRSWQEAVYLNFQRKGVSVIQQNDRIVTLRAGDVGIFDAMRPFMLEQESEPAIQLVSLMLPYAVLRESWPDFHPRLLPAKLSEHPRWGQTLAATCALFDEHHELPAESGVPLAEVVVGMTIAALRDAPVKTTSVSSRAALLRYAAIDKIRRYATSAGYDISALANQLGCTPRYVQRALASEGDTASELILSARLQHAAGEMRRPANAGKPISTIAYDAGFADLSHFYRSFRQRYGCPPGEWRTGANPQRY